MSGLLKLAKNYFRYLRYSPHVLSVLRNAYANWPHIIISIMIKGTAVGRAKDGSSWYGSLYDLFHYAKLTVYTHCKVLAATKDYVKLRCKDGHVDAQLTIYGWRNTDLFSAMTDYMVILGPKIKGKAVLDVGAFVGDSAMLFALMGARRVVAVEPSPWAYSVARKNVEANGLDNVVTLVNCAVAREGGRTLMLPLGETTAEFRATGDPRGDVPVPTCTLDELIEKYGPFDVMKMDCEGCEHESIPYSRRIGEVREVLVEYHDEYRDLEERLREEGFDIKFSRSLVSPKLYRSAVSPELGYIYAAKVPGREVELR